MIDRGRGVPVVLVPGIQGRWEWMAPAVDALARRCRVISFSLCDERTSGFPCDTARGFENFLAQIDEALRRAGVDRAVIAGVSFGGAIAAEYTARRPERVLGLVLISAIPPEWQPDARVRMHLRAPILTSPIFCLTAPGRMHAEMRAAFPAFGARARFGAGQLWRIARAFLSPTLMARRVRWFQAHRFADLAGVAAPALVVTGEDGLDRVVPTHVTRAYLSRLRNVRAALLERTGHVGLVTRPDRFAEIVAGFAGEVTERA